MRLLYNVEIAQDASGKYGLVGFHIVNVCEIGDMAPMDCTANNMQKNMRIRMYNAKLTGGLPPAEPVTDIDRPVE